ncbi:MAG: RNAse Z [Crocinitomicaceae bacterium]|nr:RNAse Z [Crocinitomicaceae bacterium]
MNLNITAYSTALFSTWINIEELGVLFDAGDGVTSGLLQKSRKIKYVFISHADRDHLTGLIQLNQLNAREGFPKIYYPADCGTFPAMKAFQLKFDPHTKGAEWHELVDKNRIEIRKDLYVECIRNEHVQAAPGVSKSLSFKIFQTKQKLKSEYLNSKNIKGLIDEKGRENIMETIHTNIFSYSGDTPVDNYEKWNNSQILMHESTFLEDSEDNIIESKGNKHSKLNEVLLMASKTNIQTLILNHFSSRYSKEEINENVISLCKKYNVKSSVKIIYPGEIHRDILNQKSIWN